MYMYYILYKYVYIGNVFSECLECKTKSKDAGMKLTMSWTSWNFSRIFSRNMRRWYFQVQVSNETVSELELQESDLVKCILYVYLTYFIKSEELQKISRYQRPRIIPC